MTAPIIGYDPSVGVMFAAWITGFARIRIVGIIVSTCALSGLTVADLLTGRFTGGDHPSSQSLVAHGHSLRRPGGVRRWLVGLCRAVGVLLPTLDAG